MTTLKELIALRDKLKSEGRLFTSGGLGAALIGAFIALPILAPAGFAAGFAAGAYGLIKRHNTTILEKEIISAIINSFDKVFREKPEKKVVFQVLLSLTDSNAKPVEYDINHLCAITEIELRTLTEIVDLLLKHDLIIKVPNKENTYTVHELIAQFILFLLKKETKESISQDD